ncbi:tyrosine-type recombinase/integrase [Ramlibacter sp. MAHUQ-53]|uniref:tyrosine-type recombinase/integrase n=1 Tax=unclassified Ramlibacter TaxID=2617605 RepID=UPI00362F7C77
MHSLTQELIDQVRCPPGRRHMEVADALVPGLFLDVYPTGTRSFKLRYSVRGARNFATLGNAALLTLDEARERARQILRRDLLGIRADEAGAGSLTVEDFFLNRYLPYVKSYKRSWGTDESFIRNHVIPHLGPRPLGAVSASELAGVIEVMRKKAYAAATSNRFLVILRYGYTLALRWKLEGVERNPAKELRSLKVDNKIERFLSAPESERLMDAVRASENPLLQYIVAFLVLTGARRREALEARWDDVNFDQASWRIPRSKSGKVRHVPLSADALGILRHLQARQAGEGAATPFVFANPSTGKPFVSIFVSWDTARHRAGLPELRIHDLRHSFASFLVNSGRSLYEVKELLGHADIKTTSRYAHLSRERLAQAVELIGPAMGLKRGG